jgi:hypothetical protein
MPMIGHSRCLRGPADAAQRKQVGVLSVASHDWRLRSCAPARGLRATQRPRTTATASPLRIRPV